MTVKQGDIVQVRDANRVANGSEIHAAIVTAAHHNGDPGMVNVKLFPDMNGIYDLGSVSHHSEVAADYTGPTWRGLDE